MWQKDSKMCINHVCHVKGVQRCGTISPTHSRSSFHLHLPVSLCSKEIPISEVRNTVVFMWASLAPQIAPPQVLLSCHQQLPSPKINNINIHLLLTVNSLQSIHLDSSGRSKKFSYNLQPASQSKNKPKL